MRMGGRYHKTRLYGFMTLLLLSGCKESEAFQFSTDDLKMVDVLVDIHSADAAVREVRDNLAVRDSLKNSSFHQIFKLHDIDSLCLMDQKLRLDGDPVRMDSVYARAVAKTKFLIAAEKQK